MAKDSIMERNSKLIQIFNKKNLVSLGFTQAHVKKDFVFIFVGCCCCSPSTKTYQKSEQTNPKCRRKYKREINMTYNRQNIYTNYSKLSFVHIFFQYTKYELKMTKNYFVIMTLICFDAFQDQ